MCSQQPAVAVRATLPLDDLDGSFTGEELRLLESWLEEHRAEEPVAVKPTSSHHLLPSSAVFSSTAPGGPSPHASAIESPGTPAHAGAWRATPSCWPSPFLEDSQAARAASSHSSPSKTGTDHRATIASAAPSQADEQRGSVLDWLSGWARLAKETEMQANASEPGFSADLPALRYRQRSWAGCDVRASMQQRCLSMAPPGPDIRASPERKRSRSCMVVPLPSVAALLPSYTGQPSKRSHW